MMYNNKLAVAIKANGRVLREFGDKVYVPFGTEYSILIKNLHTTKALININIDGNKAIESGLIIEGGKEIELERFLKKDLNKGNKFKFIERTASIEQHKGIGLEDGLITINYQFEQPTVAILYPSAWTYTNASIYNNPRGKGIGTGSLPYLYDAAVIWDTTGTNTLLSTDCSTTETITANVAHTSNAKIRTRSTNKDKTLRAEPNEAGITVPGNISGQKFVNSYIGPLEAINYSMVIKLLGEGDDNKPINRPVTVDIKPKCVTCGKVNKATSKFCNNCGTSLQIVV